MALSDDFSKYGYQLLKYKGNNNYLISRPTNQAAGLTGGVQQTDANFAQNLINQGVQFKEIPREVWDLPLDQANTIRRKFGGNEATTQGQALDSDINLQYQNWIGDVLPGVNLYGQQLGQFGQVDLDKQFAALAADEQAKARVANATGSVIMPSTASGGTPTIPTGTNAAPQSIGGASQSPVIPQLNISQNLQPGMSGNEVTSLQNWLIQQGYQIPAGATGYYGDQTKAALTKWQQDHGVNPASQADYGFFGPLTRQAISGGMPTTSGTPTTPTPPSPTNTAPTGSPTVPTNIGASSTTTNGGATTGQNNAQTAITPGNTSNATLQKLLDLMKPTAQEDQISQDMTGLDAARRKSFLDIENQPIALPFITGQEAAVQKRFENSYTNLQNQAALLQAKRLASLDATKAELDYSKPVSVATGTSLINPLTGQVIGGGTGMADKQAADTFFNLQQSYPDAGIVYDPSKGWQENLTTAQQKASKSPSFQAKNTVYAINPLTGEPTVISKMSGASGWEGQSNFGTTPTSGGGGSTNFGTTPSGGGGFDIGASGSNVSALQNWLISQGYNIPDGATGYYGQQTAAAVAAFQKAAGVDTSGGGSGTFGPRTQAAATQKGFTGIPGGSGQNTGNTGGAPNLSGLAPQLKAAVTTVGPISFFDQSKVTNAQLPYLQQASQKYGIPLLSKEDANKVQESYNAYTGATAIVGNLAELTRDVITAENTIASQTAQSIALSLAEARPELSTNDKAKQFIKQRKAILSQLARATGEKGTLSDQDIQRVQDALPGYGDSKTLAEEKIKNLDKILSGIFQSSVSTYIGKPIQSVSQSIQNSSGGNTNTDPLGIR